MLEAGDHLLKSLFLGGSGRSGRVEVSLVDTLGEQPGEPPTRYGSRHIVESAAALFESKVLVGVRFLVEPLAAPVLAMVAAPSEAAQRRGPFGRGELATGVVVECTETWYGGLFGVVSQHPGGVDLRVLEVVGREAVRYFAVGSPPVPDWYGERSEDEMRGLRWRGAGGT